jgi:hypothetical protein
MESVLNTKDEEGWALIHSVASFDYSQIIDILLERSMRLTRYMWAKLYYFYYRFLILVGAKLIGISYGERAEHEGHVGVGADSLSGKLRLLSNHRHPA